MIILGSGFSGCIGGENPPISELEDELAEKDEKISELEVLLENLTAQHQQAIDNLTAVQSTLVSTQTSLESAQENISMHITEITTLQTEKERATSELHITNLSIMLNESYARLQENITMVSQLTAERDNLQEVLVQANNTISEYEQIIADYQQNTIETEKFLVITVDVEAGNNCGAGREIQTCMYGTFGNQSAGISEMMDIGDEVGVKISFFVDVMELYAYGEQLIQVMQDIDSRGHDVQLHFHPSMINSTNWEIIQNSEEWNLSGASKDTYMTCWDQNTADFWFGRAMEIFDLANISRPIAYRSGAYRYCDTIIQAMANNNMTQSYNYNTFSSGRQNFNAGFLHNFQWENGVFEFPITYVKDEDDGLRISSRIDESTWTIPVNETFERYYEEQSSFRVMTMILHSFSFLDRNESGQYYLKDDTKLNNFRDFMHNLSEEYTVVSASELQLHIENGSVQPEFKFPLRFIENECHRDDTSHTH